MRWIYISPHLDDAVLSCGGLIYEQTRAGIPVEIWTVVCGFPPPGEPTPIAQVLHYQWGTKTAEETVSLRRAEDKIAVSIVGATPVHFGVPDCIYRRLSTGEPLYLDVFVPPHPAEAGLPDEIAGMLADHLNASDRNRMKLISSIAKMFTWLLKPKDTLVCPLTIGGHVDHVIVRAAVERLGCSLLYYTDIPYLLDHPEALQPATQGMKAVTHPVSEFGLRAWQDGIAAYASQISMLFKTEEKMREAIRAYGQAGIRLWGIV